MSDVDVRVTPRLPSCVDLGEVGINDVRLVNIGSDDATIRGFEAEDADPGYTLWVGERSYAFDGFVPLDPAVVIAPDSSARFRVEYESTGPQRAGMWLRVHGDAPTLTQRSGGRNIAFNIACTAYFPPLPDFGAVAVGAEKTLNAVLTPGQGATFFSFSDMRVREADGIGPAAGFSIAPEAMPAAGIYRDTLIVPVTFRPDRPGPFSASLLACADGSCSGYTIEGTGTPAL